METKNIEAIAKKYNLRLVVQFGSSIEENAIKHPESDIDLGFLAKSKISLKQKIQLQADLATLFGVFEDKIDLVDFADANSLISYQAVVKCKVLFEKNTSEYNQFYLSAMRRKIDEEDIFQLSRQLIAQKVRAKKYLKN